MRKSQAQLRRYRLAGLGDVNGWWDDLVNAGSAVSAVGADLFGQKIDQETAQLKAALGTIALFSGVAAVCGVITVLKIRV